MMILLLIMIMIVMYTVILLFLLWLWLWYTRLINVLHRNLMMIGRRNQMSLVLVIRKPGVFLDQLLLLIAQTAVRKLFLEMFVPLLLHLLLVLWGVHITVSRDRACAAILIFVVLSIDGATRDFKIEIAHHFIQILLMPNACIAHRANLTIIGIDQYVVIRIRSRSAPTFAGSNHREVSTFFDIAPVQFSKKWMCHDRLYPSHT
mmetsp:Transcript_1556/g.2512  ORF Transcript_1556/g.2512 Transcript_1556/m.2512 type:complete len:204 (+) Transcript_1556:1293-1904(+)